MSQDMEAKTPTGGLNKTKEGALGEYGDGMELNWSCESWGQVRNMLRGEKRKGMSESRWGTDADLWNGGSPSPFPLCSQQF